MYCILIRILNTAFRKLVKFEKEIHPQQTASDNVNIVYCLSLQCIHVSKCCWRCPVIFTTQRPMTSASWARNPKEEQCLTRSSRSFVTTKTNTMETCSYFFSLLFVQVLGNSGFSCVVQWRLYSSLLWRYRWWLFVQLVHASEGFQGKHWWIEVFNKEAYCSEIVQFCYLYKCPQVSYNPGKDVI